jgi:hypothetical protein
MRTPLPMHDSDEEEAMESMLSSAAAEEMPVKREDRESPEAVIGQIKSMVSKMQELVSQF